MSDPVVSVSRALGTGMMRNQRYGAENQRPHSEFDANTPANVDPEGLWRFSNSTRGRRTGTTAAERAGGVAGYTPGYGRSSNQNRTGSSSLTPQAQWDAQFIPHLGEQMQPREAPNSAPPSDRMQEGDRIMPPQAPAAGGIPSPGPTPPAAPAVLPILPPSPGLQGAARPTPQIEQIDGSQSSVRQVTGLPTGQRASASFVPGQNTPQNLAKRTRPVVDPLST